MEPLGSGESNRGAPYNSALKGGDWPGRQALAETDFAESPRGMVFAHNLFDPLPAARAEAVRRMECVYSEIPWPAGDVTFYQRAGLPQRPHAAYVAAAKALIDGLKKPSFIIAAKRDAMILATDEVRLVTLRGRPACLAIAYAGERPPRAAVDTADILAWLAGAYRSVYDFSCGYGAGLKPFAAFVGSDIDRRCLTYVAQELL
jgi:hypothetical protein